VKYKLPGGMDASESGFETKVAALAWGRGQEVKIREGRWADPNAGKITVSEWIDRWLALQDVGISTQANRDYLIRRFLRPAWGARPLDSLSTEEITRWENRLPEQSGISRRTARDARSMLCTILGDAAGRPRNRGRPTGRRLERAPQRAWVTPLQALLLAERAALLAVCVPRTRRRPLPAQQLRPPGVPARVRRTARVISQPPRPCRHRRRCHLAGHPGRGVAARRARCQLRAAPRPGPDDTPLACWLPIKPGLTPHGLRHGHKTWMAEDGIPEILAEQRLGHEVPGMRRLYAHASDRMRDELTDALQARWEDSLRARAAICPPLPRPAAR
jgi:hypothetical protein